MNYRQRPEANFSNLKTLVNGTLADYRHQILNPITPTRPMEIGTLIHAVALEGKHITSLAVEIPEYAPKKPTSVQRNAKKPSPETLDAIAWWDNFNTENKGKVILDGHELDDILWATANLQGNEWFQAVKATAKTEAEFYGEIQGVNCKGLVDMLAAPTMLCDLKCNSQDIGPEAFQRCVKSRHYDLQLALYTDLVAMEYGLDVIPPWCWIVQQTGAPYNLAIYHADSDWYESGRAKLSTVLAKLKQGIDTNEWPSYEKTPQKLTCPKWAQYNE